MNSPLIPLFFMKNETASSKKLTGNMSSGNVRVNILVSHVHHVVLGRGKSDIWCAEGAHVF